MDAKHSLDGPVDTSDLPKLGVHTAIIPSSKPEAIDHSPETAADDQVADVMTVPAKV